MRKLSFDRSRLSRFLKRLTRTQLLLAVSFMTVVFTSSGLALMRGYSNSTPSHPVAKPHPAKPASTNVESASPAPSAGVTPHVTPTSPKPAAPVTSSMAKPSTWRPATWIYVPYTIGLSGGALYGSTTCEYTAHVKVTPPQAFTLNMTLGIYEYQALHNGSSTSFSHTFAAGETQTYSFSISLPRRTDNYRVFTDFNFTSPSTDPKPAKTDSGPYINEYGEPTYDETNCPPLY